MTSEPKKSIEPRCHDSHHGSITQIRSTDLPKGDVDESQHSANQRTPANYKKTAPEQLTIR